MRSHHYSSIYDKNKRLGDTCIFVYGPKMKNIRVMDIFYLFHLDIFQVNFIIKITMMKLEKVCNK